VQSREEEMDRMPPNSTQNLNAKLSLTTTGGQRSSGAGPAFARPPIQSSAPLVKIFRGPSQYRGGYHLNV
jgi:hypothetical protein